MKGISKKIKLYLLNKKLRRLKYNLKYIELNLYFDRLTGTDCVEEVNYLSKKIKQYEEKIISIL